MFLSQRYENSEKIIKNLETKHYWFPFHSHIRAPYESSDATGDGALFGLLFTSEGLQNMHPKLWHRSSWHGMPICHFGILVILSCRHLENSKCRQRLSLNSRFPPKDRASKKNSAARSFIIQGGLAPITEQETTSWPPPWANCHKLSYLPSVHLS